MLLVFPTQHVGDEFAGDVPPIDEGVTQVFLDVRGIAVGNQSLQCPGKFATRGSGDVPYAAFKPSGRRMSLQCLSGNSVAVGVQPFVLLDEAHEREGVFVEHGHPGTG